MAAPTFVEIENDPDAGGGNGNNITFAWADIAAEATDQLWIAVLYKESTAAYTGTPASGTQVTGFHVDNSTGGFKYRADMWWGRVPASPSTLAWTWSGNTWRFGKLLLYANPILTETPVIGTVTDTEAAQDTQPSHPGMNIARTDSGVLWAVWNFTGATPGSPPTGFTYRVPGGEGNAELFTFDDLTTTPGATGTLSVTLNDPEFVLSATVEIATVAGGGAQDTPELRVKVVRQMSQLLAQ